MGDGLSMAVHCGLADSDEINFAGGDGVSSQLCRHGLGLQLRVACPYPHLSCGEPVAVVVCPRPKRGRGATGNELHVVSQGSDTKALSSRRGKALVTRSDKLPKP